MLNRNDIFMLNDTDLCKSWAIIDKLQPGELYNLDNITDKRRDLFRDCIKQRIDTLNDCEFNNDYTKIRKY
jgi:small-conductance mechanosensitive channel